MIFSSLDFSAKPFIAAPPNRFNIAVHGAGRQLGADFADMLHNCIAVAGAVDTLDGFVNMLAVENLTGVQ